MTTAEIRDMSWHPIVSAGWLLDALSTVAPVEIGAMAVWPFVIVHPKNALSERQIRHEIIHLRQWEETGIVLFLPLYALMFLVEYVRCRSSEQAYRSVALEREAYANDMDASYLEDRRAYAWASSMYYGARRGIDMRVRDYLEHIDSACGCYMTIMCADGFFFEVEVNRDARTLAVGYPSAFERMLTPYRALRNRRMSHYYVPVRVIDAIIKKHGGIRRY